MKIKANIFINVEIENKESESESVIYVNKK